VRKAADLLLEPSFLLAQHELELLGLEDALAALSWPVTYEPSGAVSA
jgi:hypothetical protein